MKIYPAIGLRCGRRVPVDSVPVANPTVPDEADPLSMAQHLVAQGAEWIHLMNLDGALGVTNGIVDGFLRPRSVLVHHPGAPKPESPLEHAYRKIPTSLQRLYDINAKLNVSIQFMGGVRTYDDVHLAIKLGAQRVVFDMDIARRPEIIDLAIKKWGPDRISVAVGRQSHRRQLGNTTLASEDEILELGHYLHALGVRKIVFVPERGRCSWLGRDLDTTARIGDNTGLKVILAGAISELGDLRRIKSREHFNVDGVVVADAICTSHLNLRDAVDLANLPLRQQSAGVVPYRLTESGPEFLMLFNLFFDQWQFPRGKVHNGKEIVKVALREFCKETGLPILRLHSDHHITLQYTANIRNYSIERTIDYYLAEVGAGTYRLGHENHCEARWTNPEKTWELLTETSPEQLPALDMALSYFGGSLDRTKYQLPT